jgi:3-dehydroquinate dehydratase-2
MKILVLNGPNLNMLGIREPALYGSRNYADLVRFIEDTARETGVEAEVFQSNHEGVLVDRIQAARGVFDGLVVNAAAYTHTSVAILDALKAVGLPTVEVHLTDPEAREPFRHVSYVKPAALATFAGFGFESYAKAMRFLVESAQSTRGQVN